MLGGKNPHPQTFVVGGMATPGGYGSAPVGDTATYLFPRGMITDLDLATVRPLDPAKITEQVTRSWCSYPEGDGSALAPSKGQTNPQHTGPDPPYQWLYTDRKYSWLKAPRYGGQVIEIGPLARLLVAYAAGAPAVMRPVDMTLSRLRAEPAALHSMLGRVIARALETVIVVDQLEGWLDQLDGNMNAGDLGIADTAKMGPFELAVARARLRAARGAARLAGPLGRDLGRNDLPLPGGCADHLERLSSG